MKKQHILTLLSGLLLASCSQDSYRSFPEEGEEGVASIRVSAVSRMTVTDPVTGEETPLLTDANNFSSGNEKLYISQMGTNFNPDFSAGSDNMFTYVYNPAAVVDPTDPWNDENSFNFSPDPIPISWSQIKSGGQVGNGFSLYAMYFPQENDIRFNVESDQTSLDDLLVSDIMGAYHSTSSLYSRLRFRLFHLMAYLRVTLYVPVYQNETTDDNGPGYSGFYADAFQGASLPKAATDFSIEWRTNRSSDYDPPLVILPTSPTYQKVTMYNETTVPETAELNVADFYPDYDGSPTDNVYVYNLDVIIPSQVFTDNFIQFNLTTPGGTLKTYYFSASQLATEATGLHFTQGYMQQLNLYLPRTGNKTVLVAANVNPWTPVFTDMTVNKKEPEDSGDTDD